MERTPFPHTIEHEELTHQKYIVFKWAEFYEMMGKLALPPYYGQTSSGRQEKAGAHWDCAPIAQLIKKVAEEYALGDAVVIRRQDIFAAPALEAYANAITCVIDVLTNQSDPSGKSMDLRDIADYFHEQAEKSYEGQRKLPD